MMIETEKIEFFDPRTIGNFWMPCRYLQRPVGTPTVLGAKNSVYFNAQVSIAFKSPIPKIISEKIVTIFRFTDLPIAFKAQICTSLINTNLWHLSLQLLLQRPLNFAVHIFQSKVVCFA